MFRTEKLYREACEELKRHINEGIIPSHSVSDAWFCIIQSMWESDWWKQKSNSEIRRID